MTLIPTSDFEPRIRNLKVDYHLAKMKDHGIDLIVVSALILIKTRLPKEVTLEEAFNRNKSAFTNEQHALSLIHSWRSSFLPSRERVFRGALEGFGAAKS